MDDGKMKLSHAGIKGQKWGIRRYQNPDGSLTPEGKARYGDQARWEYKQMFDRGSISRKEFVRRKDKEASGGPVKTYGRRMLEFQQRHREGRAVASSILGAIGGAAAATKYAQYRTGPEATLISGALGGALGALAGYSASRGVAYGRRLVLERSYNQDIRRDNERRKQQRENNKG